MSDNVKIIWVLEGTSIMEMLERAHKGEDPYMIYLELYANSDIKEYQTEEDYEI